MIISAVSHLLEISHQEQHTFKGRRTGLYLLRENLGMYFSLFHQWLFCRQLWFWGAHERRWAQGLSTPSSWLLSLWGHILKHSPIIGIMIGAWQIWGVNPNWASVFVLGPFNYPVYPSWKKIWHFQFPAELKISLELEQKMAVIQTTNSYRAPSIRHVLCCVFWNKEMINMNLCSRRPDV